MMDVHISAYYIHRPQYEYQICISYSGYISLYLCIILIVMMWSRTWHYTEYYYSHLSQAYAAHSMRLGCCLQHTEPTSNPLLIHHGCTVRLCRRLPRRQPKRRPLNLHGRQVSAWHTRAIRQCRGLQRARVATAARSSSPPTLPRRMRPAQWRRRRRLHSSAAPSAAGRRAWRWCTRARMRRTMRRRRMRPSPSAPEASLGALRRPQHRLPSTTSWVSARAAQKFACQWLLIST